MSQKFDCTQIPHFENKTCSVLQFGEECQLIIGYPAVYRTAVCLSGFFFVMALITISVNNSRGFRARLHNGFWIWKFLSLIGIAVGMFSIPQEMINHFHLGNIIYY